MTNAAGLHAIPLEALANPVSYRWHIQGPWGRSQQVVTVEAPAFTNLSDETVTLGGLLWGATVAGATGTDTQLLFWETLRWQAGSLPELSMSQGGFGLVSGAPSPRERSGVLIMSDGGHDRLSNRRLYVPGMPARWSEGGLLTHVGMRALEGTAQKCLMGLAGHLTGGPLRWLLAHPGELEPSFENPHGVVFRRVENVLVMSHVARAPEQATAPWP